MGRKKKTTEEFIEQARKIHGDKYDYSKVCYQNSRKKVEIVCHKKYRNGLEHGSFFQKAGAHLMGNGCPHCRNSHFENVIFKFLTKKGIRFETEKTFDWLVNKQHMYLDFFIPEKNIAIECQGIGHFLPLNTKIKNYDPEKQFQIVRENDKMKKKLCLENGIKILYFSDEATAKYNETDEIICTNKDELLKIICEDI
jgi:hypothetical protein